VQTVITATPQLKPAAGIHSPACYGRHYGVVMKAPWIKWLPLGLALASLVMLSAGTNQPSRVRTSPPELHSLVKGNTDFATELFTKLEMPGKNVAFSPYSLVSALAVAQAGAKGATESQISGVCHFPANRTEQLTSLGQVRRALVAVGTDPGIELSSATGLWAQKEYGFDKDFLTDVREKLGGSVRFVDFNLSANAAVGQINSWVEANTRGKIKEGISQDSITPATRLIIANAIYFKGEWSSRFNRNATQNRTFNLTAASSVNVPMMSQENNFLYAEADGVQLLVLPYRGQNLHMLVFLPAAGGISDFVQGLDGAAIQAWADRLRLCKVNVRLPRFKVAATYSLTEPLQALGMRDAFDASRADFTGMSLRRPLFIQTIKQSTIVEVNEQGTEAASATHTGFGCSAPPHLPQQQFHADRPFIFFIREKSTGMILFAGRVVDPST